MMTSNWVRQRRRLPKMRAANIAVMGYQFQRPGGLPTLATLELERACAPSFVGGTVTSVERMYVEIEMEEVLRLYHHLGEFLARHNRRPK